MMYRPSASARTKHQARNDAVTVGQALRGMIGLEKLPTVLAMQVEAVLRRRRRQHDRAVNRWRRSTLHAGLNGKRAVARRLRQIAAGSLREANGLVL